jgi:hypothetical protein
MGSLKYATSRRFVALVEASSIISTPFENATTVPPLLDISRHLVVNDPICDA